MIRALLISFGSLLLVAACGSERFVSAPAAATDGGPSGGPNDGSVDGAGLDGGVDADGGGTVSPDGGATSCPSGMVLVPARKAGPAFCIDATEVKQSDYAAFLGAVPGAYAKRPSQCAGKSSHVPGLSECLLNEYDPSARGTFPVGCVDWCDAWSYCDWAGKHLCGRVGGGEISGPAVDGDQDEWFRACTGANKDAVFPYGTSYSAAKCGTEMSGGPGVRAVGSLATCEGGVKGIFDMSGNVAEWTWQCSGMNGATVACATRGGSYVDDENALECKLETGALDATTRAPSVGFRCCK